MSQKLLFALISAFLLNCLWTSPAIAITEPSSDSQIVVGLAQEQLAESKTLSRGLQEVPPPVVIETIRSRLSSYHPQFSLQSPVKGETLTKGAKEKWNLVFNLKD